MDSGQHRQKLSPDTGLTDPEGSGSLDNPTSDHQHSIQTGAKPKTSERASLPGNLVPSLHSSFAGSHGNGLASRAEHVVFNQMLDGSVENRHTGDSNAFSSNGEVFDIANLECSSEYAIPDDVDIYTDSSGSCLPGNDVIAKSNAHALKCEDRNGGLLDIRERNSNATINCSHGQTLAEHQRTEESTALVESSVKEERNAASNDWMVGSGVRPKEFSNRKPPPFSSYNNIRTDTSSANVRTAWADERPFVLPIPQVDQRNQPDDLIDEGLPSCDIPENNIDFDAPWYRDLGPYSQSAMNNGLTITEYGAGSTAGIAAGGANETVEDDFIDADIPKSSMYFDKDSTASEDEEDGGIKDGGNAVGDHEFSFCELGVRTLAISDDSNGSICDRKNDLETVDGNGVKKEFTHDSNISESIPSHSKDYFLSPASSSDSRNNMATEIVRKVITGKQIVLETRNFNKNDLNARNDVKSVIVDGTGATNDFGDSNVNSRPSEDLVSQEPLGASALPGPELASCSNSSKQLNSKTNDRRKCPSSGMDDTWSTLFLPRGHVRDLPQGASNVCNKPGAKSPTANARGSPKRQITTQPKRVVISSVLCSSDEEGEETADVEANFKRDKEGRKIFPKPDFPDPFTRERLPSIEDENQMRRLRAHVWKQRGKKIDYAVCCTGIPHHPKIPRNERFRVGERDLEREKEESSTDEEYYEPVPKYGTKEFIQYHHRRRALAEEQGDERISCECRLCLPRQEEFMYNIEDYDKPWPDFIEDVILPSKHVDEGDKGKPSLVHMDSHWCSEKSFHFVQTDPQSVAGCMERKLLINLDRFQEKSPHGIMYHNELFIWNKEEVSNIQVNQIGTSACGPTAAINVLKAFGYDIPVDEIERAIPVNRRAEKAPLPEYLFSRSCAGTTAQDLIDGIAKVTNGEVAGRFFSTYPERNFKVREFITWLYEQGACCILTLNLQRGRTWGRPVPDAWHHQMVYGVNSYGIHLTNPIEYLTDCVVHDKLTSDSVLLVRSCDVINRWHPETCDLRQLMSVPDDPRWTTMNVLGQVVNVMRAKMHPTSRPVDIPTHITIPAVYKAGISVFAPRRSRTYHILMREPELPLLTPEDGPVYDYDEYPKEPKTPETELYEKLPPIYRYLVKRHPRY